MPYVVADPHRPDGVELAHGLAALQHRTAYPLTHGFQQVRLIIDGQGNVLVAHQRRQRLHDGAAEADQLHTLRQTGRHILHHPIVIILGVRPGIPLKILPTLDDPEGFGLPSPFPFG